MKQVQKEINQLSGRLERITQVTDEQVFKVSMWVELVMSSYYVLAPPQDAKKDEASRSAYKLLASIRDVC